MSRNWAGCMIGMVSRKKILKGDQVRRKDITSCEDEHGFRGRGCKGVRICGRGDPRLTG